MNYCTVSYSAAWWDWERWQRELDYMAMNSINMPLSVVGLEAVWYNTLLKHRFTDEEARHFLAGPAHAAWQWMQNLQDYGGPLPKSWIDSHIRLGKQIIQRELELGMQPIQQGFSGYVPRELKAKYPHAKYSNSLHGALLPALPSSTPPTRCSKSSGMTSWKSKRSFTVPTGYMPPTRSMKALLR